MCVVRVSRVSDCTDPVGVSRHTMALSDMVLSLIRPYIATMLPVSLSAGIYPNLELLEKYDLVHFHDFSVAIRWGWGKF